jgi:hypothetical protein
MPNSNIIEDWKPVPGFEGYEISNLGRNQNRRRQPRQQLPPRRHAGQIWNHRLGHPHPAPIHPALRHLAQPPQIQIFLILFLFLFLCGFRLRKPLLNYDFIALPILRIGRRANHGLSRSPSPAFHHLHQSEVRLLPDPTQHLQSGRHPMEPPRNSTLHHPSQAIAPKHSLCPKVNSALRIPHPAL